MPRSGMLLRMAATAVLIALSLIFAVGFEVALALAPSYFASSQGTERPAFAGLRTVPASP